MTNLTDRRNHLMSALSAAENLIAVSPMSPDSVNVQQATHFPQGALGVDLHFHHDTQALMAFAQSVGAESATVTREFGGEWFTESTVSGLLGGVPFYAWTRMTVATPAVHPLSVLDDRFRAGRLLEQQHQWLDPSEPPAAYSQQQMAVAS